jgi:hypothetical protein
MKHIGKLKPSHKGTERINKRIEEAFEDIDEDQAWESDGQEPTTDDQRPTRLLSSLLQLVHRRKQKYSQQRVRRGRDQLMRPAPVQV